MKYIVPDWLFVLGIVGVLVFSLIAIKSYGQSIPEVSWKANTILAMEGDDEAELCLVRDTAGDELSFNITYEPSAIVGTCLRSNQLRQITIDEDDLEGCISIRTKTRDGFTNGCEFMASVPQDEDPKKVKVVVEDEHPITLAWVTEVNDEAVEWDGTVVKLTDNYRKSRIAYKVRWHGEGRGILAPKGGVIDWPARTTSAIIEQSIEVTYDETCSIGGVVFYATPEPAGVKAPGALVICEFAENELPEVLEELNDLQMEIDQRILDLSEEVEDDADIASLDDKIKSLNASISSLQSRINMYVSSLEDDIEASSAKITALMKELNELSDKLDTNKDEVSTLEKKIDALDVRVTALEKEGEPGFWELDYTPGCSLSPEGVNPKEATVQVVLGALTIGLILGYMIYTLSNRRKW